VLQTDLKPIRFTQLLSCESLAGGCHDLTRLESLKHDSASNSNTRATEKQRSGKMAIVCT
jgi:hypothetical protein